MTRGEVYEVCERYPFDPKVVWAEVFHFELCERPVSRMELEEAIEHCIRKNLAFTLESLV